MPRSGGRSSRSGVATKFRWKLTIDTKEKTALEKLAGDCSDTVVEYEVAP